MRPACLRGVPDKLGGAPSVWRRWKPCTLPRQAALRPTPTPSAAGPGGCRTPVPSVPAPPANRPGSSRSPDGPSPGRIASGSPGPPSRPPPASSSSANPDPCTTSRTGPWPRSSPERPAGCSTAPPSSHRNIEQCSLIVSSIVTIRFQCRLSAHSWLLPSWCSSIPGQCARSRRLRCLPWPFDSPPPSASSPCPCQCAPVAKPGTSKTGQFLCS